MRLAAEARPDDVDDEGAGAGTMIQIPVNSEIPQTIDLGTITVSMTFDPATANLVAQDGAVDLNGFQLTLDQVTT